MRPLADDGMLGNQPFPSRVDLRGFWENLKDVARRGDLGMGLLGCVAQAIRVGGSGEDNVHLVKALRRNRKMLLIA
jgi:hypothetical protein